MGGINVGRWLAGGIVAGIVMWILEGAASMLYFAEMQAAMEKHNLSMTMNATTFALTVVVSVTLGLTLVFFYALARPRLGAGPKTAAIVAVALWIGGYFPSLIGYQMMGLFTGSLLVLWGAVGLAEMIIASMVGAWIYREEPGTARSSAVPAGA